MIYRLNLKLKILMCLLLGTIIIHFIEYTFKMNVVKNIYLDILLVIYVFYFIVNSIEFVSGLNSGRYNEHEKYIKFLKKGTPNEKELFAKISQHYLQSYGNSELYELTLEYAKDIEYDLGDPCLLILQEINRRHSGQCVLNKMNLQWTGERVCFENPNFLIKEIDNWVIKYGEQHVEQDIEEFLKTKLLTRVFFADKNPEELLSWTYKISQSEIKFPGPIKKLMDGLHLYANNLSKNKEA